jgi:hypothetical protein
VQWLLFSLTRLALRGRASASGRRTGVHSISRLRRGSNKGLEEERRQADTLLTWTETDIRTGAGVNTCLQVCLRRIWRTVLESMR